MTRRLIALGACLVLLAGCSSAGADAPKKHPSHRVTQPALSALVIQPAPSRDLYTLADQLKIRPPRTIDHVVRTASPNYPVGHADDFKVLSEDKLVYFTMHAKIRAETPHLYIYVQDGVQVDQKALEQSAQTFEKSTYPTDRSFFGSEWRPGVDGDQHITCLLGDLQSATAAGFYSAEDEYPRLVNPYSNQREMFYINTNTLPGEGGFDLTLAHEFQHMIHWHTHSRDNAWLNEGMSMLAQRVNHYETAAEAESFLASPTTQLNTWSTGDNSAHYGGAYLFLAYIYDRFGRGMIHDMVGDSKNTDFELLNDVLRKRHIPETADQVFGDWVVANVENAAGVAHGAYHYADLLHTVTVDQSVQGSTWKLSDNLPPYAAEYIDVKQTAQQKPFTVKFSAPTTVPLLSVSSGAPFWWSNRGDLIATSLQRSVDLSKVKRAHLHFRAWWNIEDTYDYGFVEASTDGGHTWTTLPGTHTTRSNPTGANYGNGYTGDSKVWHNESVNLSHYAGRKILLRFSYVTDDETNLQGMAVRSITIPEIGFHDNFTGWKARGFLPVHTNALPSHWVVRLLESTDSGLKVRTMKLSSRARGTLRIDPAHDHIKKLLAVVYTTAPKTTVSSKFQISAR